MVYGNAPGSVQRAREKVSGTVEERFSVGLLRQTDGAILDVVRDSPAWKAGLGPGMKVLATGRDSWSIQNGAEVFAVRVDGAQNGSYAQLERNAQTDLMSAILRSRNSP